MFLKFKFLVLFILLIYFRLLAQADTVQVSNIQVLVLNDTAIFPVSDTTFIIPDSQSYEVKLNPYSRSQKFFDSLYVKSYRHKISKKLYNLFITYRPNTDVYKTTEPVESESYFTNFEGKEIYRIKIRHVDIIGGSVTDTTRKAKSGLAKFANKLQINSADFVIKNQLLFKRGDTIVSFEIAESERLLRSFSFVEDARIHIQQHPSKLDSVKILIVIKERFPYAVNGSFSNEDRFDAEINNENLFGTGNRLNIKYLHDSNKDISDGLELNARTRNIGKTFTQLRGFYANNYLREGFGFSLNKNFISTEIKYGGEAIYSNVDLRTSIVFADSLYQFDVLSSSEIYDVWLGRSFQIKESQIISIASRYKNNYFDSRPFVAEDFNESFHQRQYALGAIYFTKQSFYKTRNILSFNITEDVPVGASYSLIAGRDWSDFGDRFYIGNRAAAAKYFSFGYTRFNLEAGTFMHNHNYENTVFKAGIDYFTNILDIGRTYNRTFIQTSLYLSKNLRIPFSEFLNSQDRIRDISGTMISGNQLFNTKIESIFFLPWYAYGFRFASFYYSDIGIVEENRISQPYSELYNVVGTGFRIKNEGLVFETFELRLSYFTKKPNKGNAFVFEFKFISPLRFGIFNVSKPSFIGVGL